MPAFLSLPLRLKGSLQQALVSFLVLLHSSANGPPHAICRSKNLVLNSILGTAVPAAVAYGSRRAMRVPEQTGDFVDCALNGSAFGLLLSCPPRAIRREPWATTVTAAAAAVPSWLVLLDCTHRVDSRSWATLSRCASCCCLVSCCFSGLVSSSTCVWWSARLLRLPSGGTEPLQQSAIHGVQILFKNVFFTDLFEMIKEPLEIFCFITRGLTGGWAGWAIVHPVLGRHLLSWLLSIH